jgi:hypothetical protein
MAQPFTQAKTKPAVQPSVNLTSYCKVGVGERTTVVVQAPTADVRRAAQEQGRHL